MRTEILLQMEAALKAEAKSISPIPRTNLDSAVAISVRRLAAQPVFDAVVQHLRRERASADERTQHENYRGIDTSPGQSCAGTGVVIWNFDEDNDDADEKISIAGEMNAAAGRIDQFSDDESDGDEYGDVFVDEFEAQAADGMSALLALGEQLAASPSGDSCKRSEERAKAIEALASMDLAEIAFHSDWPSLLFGLRCAINDRDSDVSASCLVLLKAS